MTAKLNIPEDLEATFQQLVRLIPARLRNKSKLEKNTLVFLKLGGPNLARQYIDILEIRLREKLLLQKKLMKEEALANNSESDNLEYPTS